jgi:hypothetical protein
VLVELRALLLESVSPSGRIVMDFLTGLALMGIGAACLSLMSLVSTLALETLKTQKLFNL